MKNTWILLSLLAMLSVPGWAQGPAPLEKVKISKALEVHLPTNMRPMSSEEIKNKYLSNRPPLAMYTTQDGKADFGIKLSNTTFLESDLALAADFYKASFVSLYDSVTFLRETIEEINKRHYLVLEFTSLVLPKQDSVSMVLGTADQAPIERYTYIQYTVVNGKLLVVNFTCPRKYMDAWRATAWDIMHSLKVKNSL